jgi:Rha family phage regulatory protein
MDELLPMITEKDGIPVTTSKAVAEQFEKRHDSVIRDIENLLNLHKSVEIESDTTQEFLKQNFIEATYTDSKGRTQPQYIMTKDGFTLLVMGYTGAKALQFKIAYINAFNRMERFIKGGGLPAPAIQSIEKRLEALEQTAGAGKPDAVLEVAATFLQAIQAALDSGEYILNQKGKPRKSDTAQLLGIKGRDRIAIPALLAYKVYSDYAAHPLSRPSLWGLLEQAGAIRPRTEPPQEVDFWGQRLRVIHIDRKNIKERSL